MLQKVKKNRGENVIKFNISKLNPRYNFDVIGASYAGDPRPGTAMYITRKVEKLLDSLTGIFECLIFIETGIEPPPVLKEKNCFVVCDNPQMAYARFMEEFDRERFKEELKKSYILQDGYRVGENVIIGEDAYIEPGCLIGHGVKIGDHCRIMAGAVIKNAVIGDYFVCGENAVVGANGFTMAEDEWGNKFRMPTLGKVIIGNHVEVGCLDNISVGLGGDTIIQDYVKIDALVYIAHDDNLGKNTEITAGVIVGGFVNTGEHAYMGINSSIRNRIELGAGCIAGMGAVVTKGVQEDTVVVGNPAQKMKHHKKCK